MTEARRILGIPPDKRVRTAISLGYPDASGVRRRRNQIGRTLPASEDRRDLREGLQRGSPPNARRRSKRSTASSTLCTRLPGKAAAKWLPTTSS